MNNLYLLTQDTNNGYDTYDACIVAAPDEETAIYISEYSMPNDFKIVWEKDKTVTLNSGIIRKAKLVKERLYSL